LTMSDEIAAAIARLRECGRAVKEAEAKRAAADHALIQAAGVVYDARKAAESAWNALGTLLDVPVRIGDY
jgi:hypothetical protein